MPAARKTNRRCGRKRRDQHGTAYSPAPASAPPENRSAPTAAAARRVASSVVVAGLFMRIAPFAGCQAGFRSGWPLVQLGKLGRLLLDQGDFVSRIVKPDVVHKGPDQQQTTAADLADVLRNGRVGQAAGIEARSLVANGNADLLATSGWRRPEPSVRSTAAVRRR